MNYTLSPNMAQYYDPKKNYGKMINMDREIMQRFHNWKPLPEISIKEAEAFLEGQFGMTKTELDEKAKTILLRNRLYYRLPMQYMGSYQFPEIQLWQQWALENELELFDYLRSVRTGNQERLRRELATATGNAQKIQDELQTESEYFHTESHKLIHLYSIDGVTFDDAEFEGLVPLLIKFSVFHLLGKAPISDETFSEWPMYLQFLMDIHYI